MAAELVVGTAFSHNKKINGRGIVQIKKGDTNVSLYGSLDGTNYVFIETFTADTIKEITMCENFKVSGANDGTLTTPIGSSKAFITSYRS